MRFYFFILCSAFLLDKISSDDIQEISLFEPGIITMNERFARHVKAVTESVIDHLLNQVKRRYAHKNVSKSQLARVAEEIAYKAGKLRRKHMKKQQKRSKKVSKNKTSHH